MRLMTTKDFIDSLGITLNVPFECGDHGIITILEIGDIGTIRVNYNWDGPYVSYWESVSLLMNEEIRLLPRYTLTEDEKVIIKSFDTPSGYCIARRNVNTIFGGYITLCLLKENERVQPLYFKDSLFTFIKEGDCILISDLRKCL